MDKDFEGWNSLKIRLHNEHQSPTFQEREVWWCSVGINVGHEIDGKNRYFNRPVLVVRKFNRHVFLGVPLTTQIKQNRYYHRIHFKGREQCVMLSQLRLWEGRRLTHSMGQLPADQFGDIRKALKEML
jgi:mRNA interferase MazF